MKSSNQKYETVLKLVNEQKSASEIARLMGVTRQAISLYLKAKGLVTNIPERPEITKAREMVKSRCWSLTEIIQETKLNNRTVYGIAANEGIKLPNKSGSQPKIDSDAIEKALREGTPSAVIANKLGVSYSSVYKYASSMGIVKKRNR